MREREDHQEQGSLRPDLDRLRILIAGSRKVKPAWVIGAVTELMNQLPPTTFLLRTGLGTKPGPIEGMCWILAFYTDHQVDWCVPEEGRNRTGTFVRDIAMVDKSDAVIVFLHPDEDPLGDTGTAHILQKALDANRPLFAYTAGPEGLNWVGGSDAPRELTHLSDLLSDKAETGLTGTP